MIKFDKWNDGLQTKLCIISSEETKNNGDVECYYKISDYIKEEIESMQNQNNEYKEILDKIKELSNRVKEEALEVENGWAYQVMKELDKLLEEIDK